MTGRGIHFRVPGDLAIIVGMDIDPAGCDDGAGGIQCLYRFNIESADGSDETIFDTDVGLVGWSAGAINDSS